MKIPDLQYVLTTLNLNPTVNVIKHSSSSLHTYKLHNYVKKEHKKFGPFWSSLGCYQVYDGE